MYLYIMRGGYLRMLGAHSVHSCCILSISASYCSHDATLTKSFNSKLWKMESGYKPDLIFASTSIGGMCEKKVLDPISHSQHRPICLSANPVVMAQHPVFRRRFNLKKANWKSYAAEADAHI